MSTATSHLWSDGQKRAYTSLLEIAELFFFTDWTELTIKPRLTPLVIGPSGIGKSTVVREVAKELGVPFMRLTASNWVPSGSRDEPTLLRVHQFLNNNDQGIFFYDELDKFRGSNGATSSAGGGEWSASLVGELFDLLDRAPSQPIKNISWSPDILQKLKQDFWMVGSGTWQQAWRDTSKSKVGFGKSDGVGSIVADVRRLVTATDAIPQELLRRFSCGKGQLIVLPPATSTDFARAAEDFGIRKLAEAMKIPLDFDAAASSGLGARWLEETMAELLLQARREDRTDLFRYRAFVPDNSQNVQDEDEFGAGSPFSNWIFPK